MLYPLPAVMVSCAREGENPNIITLAWVGTVCTNPPMVSISLRPSRYSYGIIRETEEFVINLTTKELLQAADYCGVKSGRDIDKFKELGLTPERAEILKHAPAIAESPVNIECRVAEVRELGSHHLFLAHVVSVGVEERYLDKAGKFDLNAAGLVSYSHGGYFVLRQQCGSFGYSVRAGKSGGKGKGSIKKTGCKREKPTETRVRDRKTGNLSRDGRGKNRK